MPDKAHVLAVFGSAVAELRKKQGLTQGDVARRSGLHRTYIAGVEGGHRNISLDAIVKLATGLGLTPKQLFAHVEKRGLL